MLNSIPLSSFEQKIHQQALTLGRSFHQTQIQLLKTFAQVSEKRIHHKLGYRSLHEYGVKALGLSEAIAYALGTVLKKSKESPQLAEAVQSGELSLCRASRLVSILNSENASELIEFAKNHRTREIDQEVARRSPQKKLRENIKTLSEDCVRLSLSLTPFEMKSLKRCQNLIASRKMGKDLDLSKTLSILMEVFLQHHDPVQKAERAQARKAKSSGEPSRQSSPQTSRQPSPGSSRHPLHSPLNNSLRAQGKIVLHAQSKIILHAHNAVRLAGFRSFLRSVFLISPCGNPL